MFEFKGTVASSSFVDENDVVKTKSVLQNFGLYPKDSDIHGFTDNEMFDGIKDFQKATGLKVDGVMRPKGETETRIKQVMSIFNKSQIAKPDYRTPNINPNVDLNKNSVPELKPAKTSKNLFDNIKPFEKPVLAEKDILTKNAPILKNEDERIRSISQNTPSVFEVNDKVEVDISSPGHEKVKFTKANL